MDEKSVMQQVYEYIVRVDRVVKTREVVISIGAYSVSSVTYALTRLVREGNLERVGYASYRAIDAQAPPDVPALDHFASGSRLATIFEAIRPVLTFEELSFLHQVVLMAIKLAPDLFEKARRAEI